MLLSDGMLANGSEPWQIPDVDDAAGDRPGVRRRPNAANAGRPEFLPYLRDEDTLARPWAIPGTAGLEHRIGGLEKGDGHGNISYDPANHDFMVRTRQAKVDRIADSPAAARGRRPQRRRQGARARAGARRTARSAPACRRVRKAGYHVAQVHLRHLNPFPKDLGEILKRYDRCWCPR